MEKCRNNKWEISYDWFFGFDNKLRFFWVDSTWFYLNYQYIKDLKKKIKNYMGKYWKNAEITNGRLAMIGFFALTINYGFFGWIIPGFI